jgi:hypothetical protein
LKRGFGYEKFQVKKVEEALSTQLLGTRGKKKEKVFF